MNCCIPTKKSPPKTSSPPYEEEQQQQQISENYKNVRHEILIKIPRCKVHLMDEGEAIELTNGDFELIRVSDEDVSLATTVKVGDELQWPLTKDEPVVKLDALSYLFSLPMKDGKPLSYGVTFSDNSKGDLSLLDSFLKEHSLFTCSRSSSSKGYINWKDFAPTVNDYNSVLAKAIAGGTGHIVKGIFTCSNAYTNQVQKGGEDILIRTVEQEKFANGSHKSDNNSRNRSQSSINKSLKRVRKLSKMTEKMSKAMLDVVGVASGSVVAPVVRSQAGKRFMSMVPGEVLLASLDAVNKIIDAAEAAEKQAMTATSGAVTRMVTNRFGENAGEATEDVLVTAGHCANTAWNVFKIRKAINPASSVSSGVIKNAAKSRKNP